MLSFFPAKISRKINMIADQKDGKRFVSHLFILGVAVYLLQVICLHADGNWTFVKP